MVIRVGVIFAVFCLLQPPVALIAANLPPGVDVVHGKFGEGNGAFNVLRDFSFGPDGLIYALDGYEYSNEQKAMIGNGLVQIFDPETGFVRQFPLVTANRQPSEGNPRANHSQVPGIYHDPQRIAVDLKGKIYVSVPASGVVQIYSPQGKLLSEAAIPQANVLSRCQGGIAVVGSQREAMPKIGWTDVGGEEILIIDDTGRTTRKIPLEKRLFDITDMSIDASGNFYFHAQQNQIYQFSPDGKLLKVIGSGTSDRRGDGSELIHAVAVDQDLNIYGMTMGNPGMLTQFDASVTTVRQRKGQFDWDYSWSYPNLRTIIRVAPDHRIWVAATAKNIDNPRRHPSPVIMRLNQDFLQQTPGADARMLGLFPTIKTSLTAEIAHDLQPIPVELVIQAANRSIDRIHAVWNVYDMKKRPIGNGQFSLNLSNNIEARQAFSFQPDAYGWYTMELSLNDADGKPLMTTAKHFGVTPVYAGMPSIAEGQGNGSWEDPWRQAFIGHPMLRLHPDKGLDKFAADLEEADKANVFVFGQFTDEKNCTVEKITATVTRFKGRVKVWEVVNEPNLRMSVENYVELLKKVAPVIKKIDPGAQVMGPACCGIDLRFYRRFYETGGAKYVDILSIHDYEGHESIDPVHWQWKLSELRKLMTEYGDADKPVWQTERAIGGVRSGLFQGATQAARATLQQELGDALGVTPGRNWLYYLNEGGYSAVPTYLWSRQGPHPAALALRTRAAMISDHVYAGTVDFGATGNKLMLGTRYQSSDSTVLILRNLGMASSSVQLEIEGSAPVALTDAFGNEQQLTVMNSRIAVELSQMPTYLRFAKDRKFKIVPLDLGENLAETAKVSYSTTSKNLEHLNNGIWETYQHGNPHGGSGGEKLFRGEVDQQSLPTLTFNFESPQKIGAVLIAGVRADNTFCTLLDYDLQFQDEHGQWIMLKQVRTPLPESSPVNTSEYIAHTWYIDNNLFLDRFDPVQTRALRLVIHRTTRGFVPDEVANTAFRTHSGGDGISEALWLREIEVYGSK